MIYTVTLLDDCFSEERLALHGLAKMLGITYKPYD